MNIFKNIPTNLKDELFETIASNSTCKIERIVSYGHKSDDNYFYDQKDNEWIIVSTNTNITSQWIRNC